MPGCRRSSAMLAVLIGIFGLAPAAHAAELVLVRGGGSGNGVGMSQWGAEGYAGRGWDYRRILAHYYPHTTFAQIADVPVRVLLEDGQPHVSVSSDAPFLLVDARGRKVHVPAGTVGLGAPPRVHGKTLRLPVTVDAGAQPLAVDGKAYRGALTIERSKGGLAVVNTVPLERYVRSVVPSELPAGWQPAAYRAQAVAARSYAVASIRPSAPFDLYADGRSQVYGGIASESPVTNAAAAETAGETLAYEGRVIDAMYDSSSGGRTAAVQDAFPGASPQPYLVSVADPGDSISPYYRWQLALTGDQLRARLGFAAESISVQHDPSGLASSVLLQAPGRRRSLTGQGFASLLGLRSERFSLALLTLEPPVRDGHDKVRLSGVAQDIQGAVIQRQTSRGGWAQVARIRPRAGGDYTAIVRRLPGSTYRVAVDGVAGPAVSG